MGDTKLRRIDKWAPSQNPYWFDAVSLTHNSMNCTMDAAWAGRRAGRTVITLGTYRLFDPVMHTVRDWPSDVGGMIENADTRYGGEWYYRWDGNRFQASPSLVGLLPKQMDDMLDVLKVIHADPMEWFGGTSRWLGPYYKVEVE